MKRILFALLLLLAAPVYAQYTVITASNIVGSDGMQIMNGRISFQPTDINGNPLNLSLGNHPGFMVPRPTVCQISNGIIAVLGGTCTVLDTSLTNSAHFCYRVTIVDTITQWTAPVIPCAQPTGSTWSFDSYVPVAPPTALVVAGPTGPAASIAIGSVTTGPPGSSASVVNVGSSGAALLNFTIPQGQIGPAGSINGASVPPGIVVSNGSSISSVSAIQTSQGGTGATTALGAQPNLGILGPTFNVMNPAFGATGTTCNGSGDDTSVVQAAFNACAAYNTSTGMLTDSVPAGGTVQFPGAPYQCNVTSTINTYYGCSIEGGSSGDNPTTLKFTGAAATGSCSITSLTVAANGNTTTGAGTIYTSAFPQVSTNPQNRTAAYVLTASCANSFSSGQWVMLSGFSTVVGRGMNNSVAQIASATSTRFTALLPYYNNGLFPYQTITDTGTATQINPLLASAGFARYNIEYKRILLNGGDIGVLFNSRVDTGTNMVSVQTLNDKIGYYFAGGGINTKFDNGWRADQYSMAAIYWRVGGADSLKLTNGTTSGHSGAQGAAFIADDTACGGAGFYLNVVSVKNEVNATPTYSGGVWNFLDCPNTTNVTPNFNVTFDTVWGGGYGMPFINITPPSDTALVISATNSSLSGSTGGVTGLPAISRFNMAGSGGNSSILRYAPPLISMGFGGSQLSSNQPLQLFGDVNLGQIYQYKVPASPLLFSDTAFAALPNGTTLFPGQTIAPPSYWKGANGKRYALDVVYQTGTTGTPNAGSTTCVTPAMTITGVSGNGTTTTFTGTFNAAVVGASGHSVYVTDSVLGLTGQLYTMSNATPTSFSISYAYTGSATDTGTGTMGRSLVCTSATDLSTGQGLTVGGVNAGYVSSIDASSPSAVLISKTTNTLGLSGALTFTAPTLGPEIQLLTKTAGAPTGSTVTWSQGDLSENSAATANGIAAYVNVAGGAPGTWAAIPAGNSNGVLAPAQIGTGTPAAGQYVDGGSGAWTTLPTTGVNPNTPAWLQYLGNGADGSIEVSPTGSCTTSPTHCYTGTAASPYQLTSTEYMLTALTIDSGAYVYTNAASSGGFVAHVTGACTIAGVWLANGTKNTWSASNSGIGGAPGGGGGGGTAAGIAAKASYPNPSVTGYFSTSSSSGSAGAASGGNGGAGITWSTPQLRALINAGIGSDAYYATGTAGGTGGSSGGAGGEPGSGITLTCGSINGTGGVIDVSGAAGTPASANSTGSGGGGGGGFVALSSQSSSASWPTIYTAGGPGALSTVPEALATGGSCTTEPTATLGVTSGALNGSCTVVAAGAGCGTGTGVTFNVVGGGGTLGTGTVNPTWVSGALASCTTTAGTSSGYTAATYTTSGNGGNGANGWVAEFQGW